MSDHAETLRLKRAAKGKRPQYFQDPATDKLLKMVLTLAQELSVAMDRIDALECLLDERGVVGREAFDTYEPKDKDAARRDAERQKMVERLFQPSEAEYQAMKGDEASEVDGALS